MHTLNLNLSIFMAAIRKEVLQQWRTKRFLVVIAVFLLFGLGSPVLTKMTPELIKSDPATAAFANLLPPPTVADAVSGYIDTIGSFGFILAILLGMNAVAGEKESGTAGLILSKPIPRWAFVLSKFIAQLLVYTFAFLISGLAVYYCIVVLFGTVDGSLLIYVNLLLLLCFVSYVGVVLLASVLGRSVAAAGGVGFGLYVLISLTRNIPRFGTWTPDGLMGWARSLATGAGEVATNPEALIGTLVLILICLIGSVAIFGRQEIE